MAKWSIEAWNAASNIFESIKKLPFIKELASGGLSEERFHFYINQDRQYLEAYARTLAHIASRLPNLKDVNSFLNFATGGIEVEKSLHESFSFKHIDGKSMACEFYADFLYSQRKEDVAVETAAVLPCFWIYQKIGEYILSIADLNDNPYRNWIETYGGEAFDNDTRTAIEVCDRLADECSVHTRKEMTNAFVTASKLEWLFWDSAYKMESWPC